MFQNARNNKAIHHVADTIQSLVEIGLRPISIHFNESKPRVMLRQAPQGKNLGASYKYSWGKDAKGRLYELHMLPMRDINIVWKVFPQPITANSNSSKARWNPGGNAANRKTHHWDIAPQLRPVASLQSSNDIFFSIPA